MKLMHTSRAKVLTSVVSALLLALVLQPACALATTAPEVTYKVDGEGAVTPTFETVDSSTMWQYRIKTNEEAAEKYDILTGDPVYTRQITGSTAVPNDDSEFGYWIADVDVYVPWDASEPNPYYLKCITAGTPITSADLCAKATIYIEMRNVEFTAHFTEKLPTYTVSYTTEDPSHGWIIDSNTGETVSDAEESVLRLNSPTMQSGAKAYEPHAADGWEFDYWTASIDLDIYEGGTGTVIQIPFGQSITTEQLKQSQIPENVTFTAHFKETGSNPVTPDSDATPKDGSAGDASKVLPKTGSTLPGVGVAIALCAGSVITAGVLFARKRSSQE